MIRKNILLTTASVAALGLFASSANAADNAALEAKLNQALKLIEAQSQQMNKMSSELNGLKARSTGGRSSSSVSADIEERLSQVEETVFDIDDRVGSRAVVNAFGARSLDIGGFIHTTYTSIDSDSGEASAFDTQNFELLIKADLDENFSAFFAGGFLREDNNPNTSVQTANPAFNVVGKTPEIIAWVNYKDSDALNVQVGRMITPHGIINQEHFPQVLLDPRQPQFLRPFGGQTVFPNFITGAQVHGKFFLGGEDTLQYNTYVANSHQGGGGASAEEDAIFGGRVAYTNGASGVTVGVNAASGSRSDVGADSDYDLVGADLLIDHDWLLWKTEIFSTSEAPGSADRFAWYTQPAWRIDDKWTVFYRYDFLDDGGAGNGGDAIENVVGVTFKPRPYVHLRVTGTQLDIESTATSPFATDLDSTIVQFSTTVSF
jgi:hypothetical protein